MGTLESRRPGIRQFIHDFWMSGWNRAGRWLDRLMPQCHGVSGLLDRVFCWVLGARIIGGGILFPLHGYLAVIVA